MNKLLFIACAALTACTTADLQPVPGSLIYGGQPAARLTKSPVGSQVPYRFRDQFGAEWAETYIIQEDRSLKLVSRSRIDYPDD